MGEEYIRVIPSPNFPFKTQRCSSRPYYNARVRPVRGGRSPISGCGKVFALPGPKVALNRSKTGLSAICGISALRETQDVDLRRRWPPPGQDAFPHRGSRFSPPPFQYFKNLNKVVGSSLLPLAP